MLSPFDLLNKTKETLLTYKMLSKNDVVITGVSGGCDSVCMLDLLVRLKDFFEITIVCAHLNHSIRGKMADDDADFVRSLAKKYNVEFFTDKVNIPKIQQQTKQTLEVVSRIERYNFFNRALEKYNANKIAVGHTADDCIETSLQRFIEGTSLDGLSGIYPVRNNIIRPLICTFRQEIIDYIKGRNLKFVEDITNYNEKYRRNKIRLILIPFLTKHFGLKSKEKMFETIKLLQEDEKFLCELANQSFQENCQEINNEILINELAYSAPFPIASRVIKDSIFKTCKLGNYNSLIEGGKKTAKNIRIGKKHIERVISFAKNSKRGKRIDLPNNLVVTKTLSGIKIENKRTKKHIKPKTFKNYIVNLEKVRKIEIPQLGMTFNFQFLKKHPPDLFKKKENIEYFDADKCGFHLIIRKRKKGDYFYPLGLKGKKKIGKFLTNLKIDTSNIILVEAKQQIMWIVGIRISENFKVTQNTKKILKICFTPLTTN